MLLKNRDQLQLNAFTARANSLEEGDYTVTDKGNIDGVSLAKGDYRYGSARPVRLSICPSVCLSVHPSICRSLFSPAFSAVRAVTDGQTDGRYQVHYLPASYSIKLQIKDFPQVIYAPNQNDRGSKYQSDVQNTRGICCYPYYHNDLG